MGQILPAPQCLELGPSDVRECRHASRRPRSARRSAERPGPTTIGSRLQSPMCSRTIRGWTPARPPTWARQSDASRFPDDAAGGQGVEERTADGDVDTAGGARELVPGLVLRHHDRIRRRPPRRRWSATGGWRSSSARWSGASPPPPSFQDPGEHVTDEAQAGPELRFLEPCVPQRCTAHSAPIKTVAPDERLDQHRRQDNSSSDPRSTFASSGRSLARITVGTGGRDLRNAPRQIETHLAVARGVIDRLLQQCAAGDPRPHC